VKFYWVAEAFRQVPPGNAWAISVQHRLGKQSVILRGDTDTPLSAGQKVLDTLPLAIAAPGPSLDVCGLGLHERMAKY
jgi:hypothetical protein